MNLPKNPSEALIYVAVTALALTALALVALSPSYAVDNKVLYQGF